MSLIVLGTDSITLPVGTTAQRNSSPTAGMMRFNSSTGGQEVYTGTAWAAPVLWNVQNVGLSTNTYSIPTNAMLVVGSCYHYMGSNNGSKMSVRIKNSAGTTLFTYDLTGGNEVPGGDGGSGMSSRSAWTVAIPFAAQGGSLEFYQSSGSNGFTNTINQVVLTS